MENMANIRLAITKKGYYKVMEYLENYVINKNIERKDVFNLFENPDINYENKFQKYIGWNGLEWYDGFQDVEALDNALKYLEKEGYSYKFSKIGTYSNELQEYGCNGNKDIKENFTLDSPIIKRKFNNYDYEMNLHYQDYHFGNNNERQER